MSKKVLARRRKPALVTATPDLPRKTRVTRKKAKAARATTAAAPVAPPVVAPAPILVTPPAARAALLGKTVARYLHIHKRKPYQTDAEIDWLVQHARAAWSAALEETSSREGAAPASAPAPVAIETQRPAAWI